MSKKIQTILNLEIVAGKAQPAPPLWPMLGANGVNIGTFIKDFNDKTTEYSRTFGWADVKVKTKLTVYNDRSFEMEIIWPVTSNLILWKINKKLWAWEPNKQEIGTLSKKDLEDIAEIQKNAMNTKKHESIMRIIAWTAHNMGVKIAAWALPEKKAA